MRLVGYLLSLLLAGCVTSTKNSAKEDLVLHCPAFGSDGWTKATLSQPQQNLFINKQEFAVPSDYKTLWFKSKSNSVGLCIVPDRRNRGVNYGCNSAYAIYAKGAEGWKLKDQKVAICRS